MKATSPERQDLSTRIADLLEMRPDDVVAEIVAAGDDWAIGLEAAHLLHELIGLLRPRSVLEFGAGRSSLVIAHALERIGGGCLTSIEHQPQYVTKSWQQMSRYRGVDALLVESTLRLTPSRHGLLYEYTNIVPSLRSRGPFSFVFIDAPPSRYGRDSTLLAAAPYLDTGAIVQLDDAARPQEKTAVRRWERALDVQHVFDADPLGRGVAVLRVASPRAASFAWRTFVGSIQDRVRERRSAGAG
ncbi:MAG TPA: class I SAM-dependent methyltransferase [Vicinamibacterales bacterium]|nr:class I SAM-dependent methyltransferase [Vicinamibacterales bacterium]